LRLGRNGPRRLFTINAKHANQEKLGK